MTLGFLNVESIDFKNIFEDFFNYKIISKNDNNLKLNGHNINNDIYNSKNIERNINIIENTFKNKKEDIIEIINEKNNDTVFEIFENIIRTGFFILSFPVFFYQTPKIIYAFLKLFNIYLSFNNKEVKIDLFLLTTNGGLPGNIKTYIEKEFKFLNVCYSSSLHFEDNHPGLRLKFNPFISKGYPKRIDFYKFLNNFLVNFEKYFYIKNNISVYEKNQSNKKKNNKLNIIFPYINFMRKLYSSKFIFLFLFKKRLNKNNCILCKVCEKDCPTKIIKIDDEKNLMIDYNFCIGCYRCTNICPFNAINGIISKYGIKYKRFIKKVSNF